MMRFFNVLHYGWSVYFINPNTSSLSSLGIKNSNLHTFLNGLTLAFQILPLT